MRLPLLIALALVHTGALLAPTVLRAEPSGITTMGKGCSATEGQGQCHGPESAGVIVEIDGPETLALGEVGLYSIALREVFAGFLALECATGPDPCGAGLNVALSAPHLFADADVVDPNTRLSFPVLDENPGEITHLFDANTHQNPGSIGVYEYRFEVTAPATPGDLSIFGAMNAFNGDDDNTGDHWSVDVFVVAVPEPRGGVARLVAGLSLLALWVARRPVCRARLPRSRSEVCLDGTPG